MKFKTNARCGGCKAAIMKTMSEKFPDAQWSLDLQNADKILEMHGVPDDGETAAKVIAALEETGFKGSWIHAE